VLDPRAGSPKEVEQLEDGGTVKKKMKKIIVTLLLIISYSCASIKGQAYIDVNENMDFEPNEDVRFRTRFKVGYKIYLGEKKTLFEKKQKQNEYRLPGYKK
tara:strand:+ start:128 stop:430 length:303 start_codon:yes stop_codon:yes gene_type:complete